MFRGGRVVFLDSLSDQRFGNVFLSHMTLVHPVEEGTASAIPPNRPSPRRANKSAASSGRSPVLTSPNSASRNRPSITRSPFATHRRRAPTTRTPSRQWRRTVSYRPPRRTAPGRPLLQMEHLAQFVSNRAIVGIGRHDLAHVRPPLLANIRPGNRGPARLVFDLRIAK